jgi:CPA2 family monovalent cation:H+ antiporter-2
VLGPASAAVGQTLASIDLRARTGATVLAIRRGSEALVAPTGREVLRAEDVLALAGTREAVDAARGLLSAGAAESGATNRRARGRRRPH